jgi:putative transport protein
MSISPIVTLFQQNPLLLLFLVGASGFLLGKIRVAGVSIGVATVLFTGLAFGVLHPDIRLPAIIGNLGLVLFVYTIGLSSGHQFVASLRGVGLRDNLFALLMLLLAFGLTIAAHFYLTLPATTTAGLFTGSVSNAASLAAALEYLQRSVPLEQQTTLQAQTSVSFSLGYPMAILSVVIAIAVMQRLWRIDYPKEAAQTPGVAGVGEAVLTRTLRIMQPAATTAPIETLRQTHKWDVVFGRWRRGDHLELVQPETTFIIGDEVTLVGSAAELERVTAFCGEAIPHGLDLDRTDLDYRRMFVSNPQVVGQRIGDLHLPERLGAVITRVRRGDAEMMARPDLRLALGDRVRVTARRANMEAIGKFFGDSYRALSEIDVLTFNLGIALGLLLGMVRIPLPGGVSLTLGIAGGPLVAALVLSYLDRTGPLVWHLPYNANLTLRQIGLVCFLATVGVNSGWDFGTTLMQGNGVTLLLVAFGIALVLCFTTLILGYKLLKIPMGTLIGILAGIQTQPGAVSFAVDQTHDDRPAFGYAAVFPTILIAKIVLAQLVLALFL